jgi:serine/threonine-protein kinase
LINRDGEEVAKLLDFGIAKFTDEGGVTRAGMTMGTPQYMAPERIIANAKVGAHADIYALGMVLYEALTGATAFNSPAIATILRGHCFEAVVPPSQRLGAPLPPVLEAAIMKCLEKKPEHRFATADELASALRSETPVERSTSQPSAVEPERRRSTSKQLALAALIASIALAVHLWPKDETKVVAAATSPSLAAVPPAAAPAAAPAVVEPVRPPAPATITVEMTSKPVGATILIGADKRPLGTVPVTAMLPKSNQVVSLIARFPDGTEVTETIVPDRSRASLVFTKPRPKSAKAIKPAVETPPTEPPDPNDRDGTLNPFTK